VVFDRPGPFAATLGRAIQATAPRPNDRDSGTLRAAGFFVDEGPAAKTFNDSIQLCRSSEAAKFVDQYSPNAANLLRCLFLSQPVSASAPS
jgi:hypothetical protein